MENNDADNMNELLLTTNKIDPTDFDVTVSAFLTGLGAEKYVDIFRFLRILFSFCCNYNFLKHPLSSLECYEMILNNLTVFG